MTFAGVIAHGAVGDGVHDDTASIQSAINDGNVVVIPPATYLVSDQITVPSNRFIKLMPGATLFRKDGTGKQHSNTYDNANFFANSDPVNGNTNIVIEGGIFDGNQANQPTVVRTSARYCGSVAMRFLNVTHLTIRGCVFKNNIIFNIQIGQVDHFLIEHLAFYFTGNRLNQDAVHVNGPASNGVIRDIWSSGGNDALIALNANDDNWGLMCAGDIQYVLVENVTCSGLGIAPYIGSAVMLLNSLYNIRDVTVRNFHGPGFQATSFIMLLALEGTPTGIIDRLVVENCDISTPCVNDAFCLCNLKIGNLSFINNRWRVGSGAADPAATSQCFLEQTGGSIENLFMSGNQIIRHRDASVAPIYLAGTVGSLMLANTIFTRDDGIAQGGYLVDVPGTVHVVCINGVSCSNLTGLVNNVVNVTSYSATGIASWPTAI